MDELSALAREIVMFRARHRLTAQAFAQKCGVSVPTIRAIMRGKKVDPVKEARIMQTIEEEK